MRQLPHPGIPDPEWFEQRIYGRLDGRDIFWCWKHGEEKIEHWHELEAGYQGRQPVPEVVRG